MQATEAAEVTDGKADIRGHWLPAHGSDSDVEILDVDPQTPNANKVTS